MFCVVFFFELAVCLTFLEKTRACRATLGSLLYMQYDVCVCATLDFARLCFIVTLMRVVWTAYARIGPPNNFPACATSGPERRK